MPGVVGFQIDEHSFFATAFLLSMISAYMHASIAIGCQGSMSAECSPSSLDIPKEVVSILASIDGDVHSQPVWNFARHGNGYSLQFFAKAESAVPILPTLIVE